MNPIAKKIRELREKNNFSQAYLASYLGVSRPTYVLIEQG
ncbi:MAG: helix-turn-helix domain-containing protein, partial [Candidatus Saccharicenans sp.]|nr:helix-turn-helix domain-containing protein [Candidatus Saccharicenans sp.]